MKSAAVVALPAAALLAPGAQDSFASFSLSGEVLAGGRPVRASTVSLYATTAGAPLLLAKHRKSQRLRGGTTTPELHAGAT